MNEKFLKKLSDKNFIEKIMTFKTKEEIKNFLSDQELEAADEEIDMLITTILKSINSEGTLSEGALEEISGGYVQSVVKVVGQVVTFPVKAVFYTAGAILASVPKGTYDGFVDSWDNWKEPSEGKK